MGMIEVTGVAQRVLFPNDDKEPDGGYAIIAFSPDGEAKDVDTGQGRSLETSKWGTFVAKGALFHIKSGMSAKLVGHVQHDSRYGAFFSVHMAIPIMPHTSEEAEVVLSSGILPGVGAVIASRLVKEFGADVFSVLDNSPDDILKVKGINEKKLTPIKKSWNDYRAVVVLLSDFARYDVSTNVLMRAYKKWGGQAGSKIFKNPYIITRLFGVGFVLADKLAASMEITGNDIRRIGAGVEYTLELAGSNGHVCLPDYELVKQTNSLFCDVLHTSVSGIPELIDVLIADETLAESTLNGTRYIYIRAVAEQEKLVASRIRGMARTTITGVALLYKNNQDALQLQISEAEKEFGFKFADSQVDAIRVALTNTMSVITGQPGVGKTTIIRAIVHILKQDKFSVLLAAPTGKAAMRMEEATGNEAKTIHRMLEAQGGGAFGKNSLNTLSADYIIVDEFSMVGNYIASKLFDAIDTGTHILLVGDIDQLPSVGAGNVLRDIISSGLVPTVRLDVIFRQDEGSNIIENAHKINHGDTNLTYSVVGEKPDDMFFFRVDNDEVIHNQIIDLVQHRLPSTFGYSSEDIQVLTPMRRGRVGANGLNNALQGALNPSSPQKYEHRTKNGTVYRVGDRVMQIRNNYDKDVFNGEVGTIRDYDEFLKKFKVEFSGHSKFVSYEPSELNELRHAWATTIHKSQGSEYPVVIVVMTRSHHVMLARNLLYTAITRARKMAIVIGQEDAIVTSIRTNRVAKRHTGLKFRLEA